MILTCDIDHSTCELLTTRTLQNEQEAIFTKERRTTYLRANWSDNNTFPLQKLSIVLIQTQSETDYDSLHTLRPCLSSLRCRQSSSTMSCVVCHFLLELIYNQKLLLGQGEKLNRYTGRQSDFEHGNVE